MGSFGGEKNYACVSEESIHCAPLSDKEMQNRICNESYPQAKNT